MTSNRRYRVWSKLHNWRFLAILIAAFAVTVVLVFWYVSRVQTGLVQSTAIANAALYSQALAEFRSLYTSEVVITARKSGLEITHDYTNRDGAIPLPATLSMLLGRRIGQHETGASARLYSAYPFPWRQRAGAVFEDEFGQQAWEFLTVNVNQSFFRFESLQGRPVLRYATADLMRPSCVGCHNSHPDTPKNDWEVGQVRGVLEVILPMDIVVAQARQSLRGILLMLIFAGFVCVVGIATVVGKLRRNSQSLQVLVNERTGELAAARDQALDASKSKSAFLANMSHEIRTPMNAVLGYAQLLERDDQISDEQRQSVSDILKSGRHLMDLISDVLDLSKIEANAMELNPTAFDLGDLIHGLKVIVKLRCEHKGLNLVIDNQCDDQLPLYGDQGKLRQVLINLLNNAVKFTDQGEVRLTVRPGVEGEIEFEIKDTGIGIVAAEQKSIFEPFQQAEDGFKRGGTGLGLAITKRQIELMGGNLTLDSNIGEGSCFSFKLPLPRSETVIKKRHSSDRMVRRLKPGTDVTALVVDDVAENRDVLVRILRQAGVIVREASNGQEAIDILQQLQCDIVYLDIRMPIMDGKQALREMLKMFPDGGLKIVAVSASSMRHQAGHYLDMGFDEYISKPFHFETIFDVLQRLLDVKFDYLEPLLEPVAVAEVDVEAICLPDGIHQRLSQAVALYRVSEITVCLDEISELGERDLATQLRVHLGHFDMDAMAAIIKRVRHEP